MRIAIDAHMIGTRETGNETYVLNLLRALARLDTVNEYFLLTPHPRYLPTDLLAQPNFTADRVFPSASPIRIALTMPYLCWRRGYHLLHVSYVAPPCCPAPTVVTVHDVSYEIFPDFFSPWDRRLLSTFVPLSVRRAAKIIAPSEHTKNDIVKRYGIDGDSVVVTHYASDPRFKPISNRDQLLAIREKYGITREFILTVGNLQPRKNIARLIKALDRLRERHPTEYQLVVVGQPSWRAGETQRLLDDKGLREHVILAGYVPPDDLLLLYNAATLFVYPSLYEGFGFPPLEAMACGTPVIASNVSSLPEILGDGAILVDPNRVEALTDAMLRLLAEPTRLSALRARGFARSKLFSWEATARRTLLLYEELAGGSAGTRP